MDIAKGVSVDYKDGKIIVAVEIASMVAPVLASLQHKVESGEIDAIKGTDLDKEIILKALEFLQSQVSK